LSSVEQRDMRYKRDLYNKESERPEKKALTACTGVKGCGCVSTDAGVANRDLVRGI
jgi:hypothetical protein